MYPIEVIVYNAQMSLFTKETLNSIEDYYKFLDCRIFDMVEINKDITLYVDDEGLFKSGNNVSDVKYEDFERKIAGNIIVTGGIDDEGNDLPCKLSIIQVSKLIEQTEYVVK